MGGVLRKSIIVRSGRNVFAVAGMVAVGAILAGCSSDVTRFDYPAFGLTSANPQGRQPTPPAPLNNGAPSPDYSGAPANYPGNAQGAAVPPPDYGGYGENSPAPGVQPNYAYRGPAPKYPAYGAATSGYGAPVASTYGSAPPASTGFGTVPGQPESYKQASFAPGQTSYITNGSAVPAAPYTPLAAVPGSSRGLPHLRRLKEGSVVEVLPGETLTQVARRNGVSVAALMQVNRLRSPVVVPGQKLTMPGKGGRSILAPTGLTQTDVAPAAAPASVALAGPALAAPAVTQPAYTAPKASAFAIAAPTPVPGPVEGDNPNGTYTVRAGDSIYSIARKHGVRPEAIAAANGITDVTKVKFGQALKMPGTHSTMRPQASVLKPLARSGTRVAALQPVAPVAGTAPVMTDANTGMDADGIPDVAGNDTPVADAPAAVAAAPAKTPRAQPQTATKWPMKPVAGQALKVAALPPADPASAAPATSDMATDVPSDGRFRWPVRGRIIGKFGPTGKAGAQNEGVDMAVPMGTEVHAAENGVVAYSGDELKGYGKLILIRHADNWVSAYAHNDELLVKRGDTIRRGQIIAKTGKSGGVDQPLLHFELRKGSQPVDPMPHMASN